MFGIGSTELVLILLVALLVLGPKKLPGIAKSIGKALGEFRRAASDVKQTIEQEAVYEERKKRKAARTDILEKESQDGESSEDENDDESDETASPKSQKGSEQ